jgi:SAM-dependent methyltransferase
MFYDLIARYYEAETQSFTADLPFYLAKAQEKAGQILDVACGTGRVTLPLAQAGYTVVGVDSSAEMLALAKRKSASLPHVAGALTWVEADILAYQTERHFDLLLLPYNALMHFTRPAHQRDLLSHLASLAAPDAQLVLDLPNPAVAYAEEDPLSLVFERIFIETQSGNQVIQQSINTLDRTSQQLEVTWIYDEITPEGLVKRILAPLSLRYIFPLELEYLLELTGWRLSARYGDYDGGPFEDACPRLLVVAQKV